MYKEAFGIARVIEALSTHTWRGMKMKNRSTGAPSAAGAQEEEPKPEAYISAEEVENMKKHLFSALEKEDDVGETGEEEGFEKALGNLAELRGFIHLPPTLQSQSKTWSFSSLPLQIVRKTSQMMLEEKWQPRWPCPL